MRRRLEANVNQLERTRVAAPKQLTILEQLKPNFLQSAVGLAILLAFYALMNQPSFE